jgi:hypothetical protein
MRQVSVSSTPRLEGMVLAPARRCSSTEAPEPPGGRLRDLRELLGVAEQDDVVGGEAGDAGVGE